MTIAIGTLFSDGAIVCADTMVVASDGATTTDTKVSMSITPKKRMFLVADAADDAYAAKMMAREIVYAACDAEKPYHLGPRIKAAMESWYNSYHHIQPPLLQFILASVVVGGKSGQVYLCEPPSTVASGWPIAIGKGARAVEPMLSILGPGETLKLDVRSTLLRLAYLMYLAKKDEGSACGGDTHTFVISTAGTFASIKTEEMKKAEELAKKLDSVLRSAIRNVMSGAPTIPPPAFCDAFQSVAEEYKKLGFPSLKLLERHLWPKGN